MPTYIIGVKEVWEQSYKVNAPSAKKAIAKIGKGGGKLLKDHFYYCSTEASVTWRITNSNQCGL